MDTAEIFVTCGGLALIGLTLWFFFGTRDDVAPVPAALKDNADSPIYVCPMHSWITSTDPAANCSLCGMKLVRRDA
jgi:hypothetical protein